MPQLDAGILLTLPIGLATFIILGSGATLELVLLIKTLAKLCHKTLCFFESKKKTKVPRLVNCGFYLYPR